MRVQNLELNNFRSYERETLHFEREVTVFSGENAKGKTNLLEALYLCCTARSHRSPRDRELIRFTSEKAKVICGVFRNNGPVSIQMELFQKGRKKATVGGLELTRIGELLGVLNGVMFSPEDLRLVKDGPEVRRRFIDISLSQVSPLYFSALLNYLRALKQRNNLLKEIREAGDREDLEIWDRQLSRYGAQVILRRKNWVERMGRSAETIYENISGGREHLRVCYQTEMDLSLNEEDLAEQFYNRLQQSRREDFRKMTTTCGPHRDEMEIRIGDNSVRAFGSQGQQRTSALSLKLAELRLMEEETGEPPILLLDDVMSELDDERQRLLLHHTTGVQTFIACTNHEQLPPMGNREKQVFSVEMENGLSSCMPINNK